MKHWDRVVFDNWEDKKKYFILDTKRNKFKKENGRTICNDIYAACYVRPATIQEESHEHFVDMYIWTKRREILFDELIMLWILVVVVTWVILFLNK